MFNIDLAVMETKLIDIWNDFMERAEDYPDNRNVRKYIEEMGFKRDNILRDFRSEQPLKNFLEGHLLQLLIRCHQRDIDKKENL